MTSSAEFRERVFTAGTLRQLADAIERGDAVGFHLDWHLGSRPLEGVVDSVHILKQPLNFISLKLNVDWIDEPNRT